MSFEEIVEAMKKLGYVNCSKANNSVTFSKAVAPAKKSVEAIAREVIVGKWGNGAERKNRLTQAGYNYSEVQKCVNKLLTN